MIAADSRTTRIQSAVHPRNPADDLNYMITPEELSQHGLTESEYQRIVEHPEARAHPDGTRHLQRDVERALQLQELTRPPETPADERAGRPAGPGRERRHHRHRRRPGRCFQDRIAQSSVLHRAVSGRRHRRRRHSSRHLHDGRAAHRRHEQPALRAAATARRTAASWKASSAGSLSTETASAFRRSAVRLPSRAATRRTRW